MAMQEKKKIDICLIVDRSGSLKAYGGDINNALVKMVEEIKNALPLHGCEVYFSLISFANDMTKNIDFVPIESVSASSLALTYQGQTNPGPALSYTVEKAYNRYYQWKNAGNEVFHPLIIFFTDGYPYPEEQYMPEYKKVAEKIKELVNNGKILFVCAGFGDAIIKNLELLTKTPGHVVQIDGDRVDKLTKYFEELIPQTVTAAVTDAFNQIVDMFKFFIES